MIVLSKELQQAVKESKDNLVMKVQRGVVVLFECSPSHL